MHPFTPTETQTREYKFPPNGALVFIGDSTAALLNAIFFAQRGVKNISVIGPRLGEYTRSGDLIPEVFEKVSQLIAPLEVIPSEGYHIKDIERQMYKHAKKMAIQFIKSSFSHFGPKRQLILKSGAAIHADILFDCTGTRCAVLKKFNAEIDAKKVSAPKFNRTAVDKEAPIKSYVQLRGFFRADQENIINDNPSKNEKRWNAIN
ncbi:MAG: hypothetical protein JSR33_11525, partial [Proteobacteria bacterium]|nr:hypothetical protein [Pseudomonadota bacterium]